MRAGKGEQACGIKLNLTWNDQIGKDFSYNIGINGAYNKNKVGEIPIPLLLVCGNHTKEDIAGVWKTELEKQGYWLTSTLTQA